MKGKNKINKYLTSKSKNVYIDKSADPVNEYNITYCTTTKMNPIMEILAHILTLM